MQYHIEERIHPNLDYHGDEDPIGKLEAKGWELVQLVPEYDLVECDPPRKLHQANGSKALNITGTLQVSNYRGVFRK